MKSADLKSIRAMKELKILSLKSTPVRDLSPLAGMDLSQLNLKGTGAADLSPLRQIKLRELLCDFDAKRDAAVLRSMPDLEKINDLLAEEFWLKEKGPEPAAAPGPETKVRAAVARMKQLNPAFGGQPKVRIEDGEATEFQTYAFGLTDIGPLSELKSLRRLWLNGRWDEALKKDMPAPLRDLRPLRGLPLVYLVLDHTEVEDLSPLQGMKIEELNLASTPVSDLSPLRGMPLKKLWISWTKVRDLAPLEGQDLEHLDLRNSTVVDFAALRSFRVRHLMAPLDPKRDGALVASLKDKGLETINGVTVAEFLKSAEAPVAPGVTPRPAEAGLWKNAIDLLAAVEPARDVVRGTWKKENGRIVAEFGENAVLRIPYEPPAEYDFRIVFTRARGTCAIAQFLVREGRSFFWEMAGWGNSNSGFAFVGGRGSKENPTSSTFVPRDGVRYTSVIQVRRDRVTAFLDDKKISEWLPAMGEITTDANWCVDVPNLIGIGNCESLTTFEAVQVREVTGKGRLRASTLTPPEPAFLQAVSRLPAQEQGRRVVEKLKELNLGFDTGQAGFRIENDRVVEFGASSMKLTDLWPLRALPHLRKLDLGSEKPALLSDVSFLKGMKIQELNLKNTRVADLSPLKDLPLQVLVCDRIPATDYSPLKSIRTLKTINDQPAAEFFKSQKEGWTPIFDGRSLDFLRRSVGWKVDKGALVNTPEDVDAGQTVQEYENGEFRIRFEVLDLTSVFFTVRQSDRGGYSVLLDRTTLKSMEGRPHEVILTCQGERVTATLNGKPLTFSKSQPAQKGCLQFNGIGRQFRISSMEFRPLP
jgi:Leucine-rich repeat (LRR) protein